MGSALGVMKVAACRLGISLHDYQEKIRYGQKWCTTCKVWRMRSDFTLDRHRGDGLKAGCNRHRRPYQKGAEPLHKRRSRRRVHMRVRRGTIPHPKTLKCFDCGSRADEYDHPRGYDGDAAVDVEAVCKDCHCHRGVQRGEFDKR